MEHTAEHIAGELRRVTDEWGISNKVAAIVIDNASNMVAAVRITGWIHSLFCPHSKPCGTGSHQN